MFPLHTIRVYGGMEVYLQSFLTTPLEMSFTLQPLYNWLPMNMRMGGAQSRSGSFGEKRLPGIEPRIAECPACNSVTILADFRYWRLIRASTFLGGRGGSLLGCREPSV